MKLSGFQSTPSARRATFSLVALRIWSLHFNPRPPRGGRPSCTISSKPLLINFNPRPPRGGRPVMQDGLNRYVKFQSTPSARRATRRIINQLRTIINFNPRPPRGGRHHRREPRDRLQIHFNPRPPRGGRLIKLPEGETLPEFQSTPSARRATHRGRQGAPVPPISIHALREEGDSMTCGTCRAWSSFQSTPSARRATSDPGVHIEIGGYFNPRPPRGGRHRKVRLFMADHNISIHALREEGDC